MDLRGHVPAMVPQQSTLLGLSGRFPVAARVLRQLLVQVGLLGRGRHNGGPFIFIVAVRPQTDPHETLQQLGLFVAQTQDIFGRPICGHFLR